jgi:hypothetical protein
MIATIMRWPGFEQNKNRISGDASGAIFMVIACARRLITSCVFYRRCSTRVAISASRLFHLSLQLANQQCGKLKERTTLI